MILFKKYGNVIKNDNSEYCMDSLKTWGLFKGLYLSMKRIIKCHPWGGKGYDPVPKKTSRA